jgi:hypothetical protein
VLWFALTRDAAGVDWKVATTAGSWHQLTQYLWPEIHKWAGRLRWDVVRDGRAFNRAELQNLNLRLAFGHAFAAASANAALIEGAHADSLLFVYDEAKAIPAGTFDACEGAFSGSGAGGTEAYALALSTPGAPQGRFYDIQSRRPGYEDWHPVHVTLADAMAAGRITADWAAQRLRQWGALSSIYVNRVLGEFHAGDEDAVIPLAWAEAAVERWHAWEAAGKPDTGRPRTVGVDVARFGGDKTVLAVRNGPVVTELRRFTREDTMATTGRVKGILDADTSRIAVVDVIGIGAGVVDRLREQHARVVAFNASRASKKKDHTREMGFYNCLTGDARVTPVGQPLRIYRSRHEGPLFKVEMASGDCFTATPNHQVLTLRGWVAVQSLHAGDKLCDSSRRDAAGRAAVEPEVNDVPPTLREVYRAADVMFGAERVQRGAVNFHGDRPAGEVDVVTVDRRLLPVRPSAGEHPEHDQLVRLPVLAGQLPGPGALAHPLGVGDGDMREGAPLPRDGVLSAALAPLGQGQPVLDEVGRLSYASRGNPVVTQDTVDHVSGHLEGRGESVSGLAGGVTADHGLLIDRLASQAPRLGDRARGYPAFSKHAADDVPVHAELLGEGVDGGAGHIAANDFSSIHLQEVSQSHSFGLAPWLDAVFIEDLVNGGPVGSEKLAERLHRSPGLVTLDEIISIELTSPAHNDPFVYTLETSTGAYRTSSVVQRNCRSEAWWTLRELLDPSADPDIALPDDEMLLGDLSTPKWEVRSGGKIKVESTDDIRTRIGRSPDDGTAVVQAFVPHLGDASPGAYRKWAGAIDLDELGSTETKAARRVREIAARAAGPAGVPAEAPWDLDGFAPAADEQRPSRGNVRGWQLKGGAGHPPVRPFRHSIISSREWSAWQYPHQILSRRTAFPSPSITFPPFFSLWMSGAARTRTWKCRGRNPAALPVRRRHRLAQTAGHQWATGTCASCQEPCRSGPDCVGYGPCV